MHNFSDYWQQQLVDRVQNDLYRSRSIIQSAQSTKIIVQGESLINFASNDYLGLANHPKLIEASEKALKKYGVGAGASHLICGHGNEHHALEEELAAFTGRDQAVLFSTGYMANSGIMSALLDKDSAVFQDKLNHASLLDGGLLSAAAFKRFQHNDLESLELRLKNSKASRNMIAIDGVFSMDGDLANLPAICQTAKKYKACVMVDDAHGFGVLGETGAGITNHFGLSQEEVTIYMGTLGKSIGSFGAFVAGEKAMIENIIQFARSYIYTTALPSSVAAASRAGLKLLTSEAWRREKLTENIEYFKLVADQLSLPLMPSMTAIQPILIGNSKKAKMVDDALFAAGFFVKAIRPPTVERGRARLRVTLSAEHTKHQIDECLDTLNQVLANAI